MDQKEVARRLEQIRKTVREELAMEEPAAFDTTVPQQAPFELHPTVGIVVSGDPNLTTTPELEAANESVDPTSPLPSGSAAGPLINLLRRLFQPFVKVFVGGHLRRQQEFNTHTVRHLNELGQRLEQRVRNLEEALEAWSANPGGIEARLQQSLDEYDAALRQRHMTLFSAMEEEIFVARNAGLKLQQIEEMVVERAQAVDRRFDEKDDAFGAAIDELRGRQQALDGLNESIGEMMSMRSLLRQALSATGGVPVAAAPASDAAAPTERPEAVAADHGAQGGDWQGLLERMGDEDYRALQGRFRGDPEEILDRMREHVARFEGAPGMVADLGCGRGEFLDLLAEAGIEAIGVEINAADVEECKRRGHEAVVADLFDWLKEQPESSLGGIFLAQVIEHLPPPQWQELVELALTRLAPGGSLAVETINAESLYAMARAYIIDPTHVRPVHPELLAFLARRAGFHPVEIEYQSPVPADVRPSGVTAFESAAAGDPTGALAALKEAIVRLDRICCAPQEYTVYATRPAGGDAS